MNDRELFLKEVSRKDLNFIEFEYSGTYYTISSFYIIDYDDKEFEFGTLDEALKAKVLKDGKCINDVLDEIEITLKGNHGG